MLELLRVASDEVARRLRPARVGSLRGPPGVLLARGTRVRVGADAAGARPGSGRRGVEPPGMGPADGQDPAWTAAARREPASQPAGDRLWTAGQPGAALRRRRCARRGGARDR